MRCTIISIIITHPPDALADFCLAVFDRLKRLVLTSATGRDIADHL
jgi:hypothetical protein